MGKKSESSSQSSKSVEKKNIKSRNIEQKQKEVKHLLKIYHLTRNVNSEHLSEIFQPYGSIIKVDLPLDPQSKHHRGFASIQYQNQEEAKKAELYMNGSYIECNKISCQYFELKPQSDSLQENEKNQSKRHRSRTPQDHKKNKENKRDHFQKSKDQRKYHHSDKSDDRN